MQTGYQWGRHHKKHSSVGKAPNKVKQLSELDTRNCPWKGIKVMKCTIGTLLSDHSLHDQDNVKTALLVFSVHKINQRQV